MRPPILRALPLVPAVLLLTCGLAAARAPQLRESTPAAEAILDGRNLQYVVRFDAPVDHAAARLEVSRDGTVVQWLHPLLDSAPEVLFSSGSALPPGRYTLHWQVAAPSGGDTAEGEIPFSVRP
jgi:methionine-rich copper-binding protein CopC